MLTLDQAKAFLRIAPPDTAEDAALTAWLTGTLAAFRLESKRRWPAATEPYATSTNTSTTPATVTVLDYYADPAALSPDEQAVADQWLRFTLGHWYENRQTVAVGLNMSEVPETARKLMSLLRRPTL